MAFHVYILECGNGTYYTGSTKELEVRLQQHIKGLGSNHTKKHGVRELVYLEEFTRIDHAFEREKQIQSWRREKKEALIEGNAHKLHELAKCLNESTHRNFVKKELS